MRIIVLSDLTYQIILSFLNPRESLSSLPPFLKSSCAKIPVPSVTHLQQCLTTPPGSFGLVVLLRCNKMYEGIHSIGQL